MVRRNRWKLSILLALLVTLVTVGTTAGKERTSGVVSQLLGGSSVATSRGLEPMRVTASVNTGQTRVDSEASAADGPRFDEFTVRALVHAVSAPPGAGVPAIESVVIDPQSITPLIVNLEVSASDNGVWRQLSPEERRLYAREVLAALAAWYPEVKTHHQRSVVYFAVEIWERSLAAGSPDPENPSGLDVCTLGANQLPYQECNGAGVRMTIAVPARHKD